MEGVTWLGQVRRGREGGSAGHVHSEHHRPLNTGCACLCLPVLHTERADCSCCHAAAQ